ncbi:MAG: isochorismatase family protein [Gammaproteobacteria bacterium]|nr:isochorismatase family protein [Gammaproteobacteria bacterium]
MQNDFCPGGKLAVPDGDAVVPVINAGIQRAQAAGIPIIASRDWHPQRHVSFEDQGGPWPEQRPGLTANRCRLPRRSRSARRHCKSFQRRPAR